MAQPAPAFVDQGLVKAIAHPIRVEILNILNDGPSSPSRIARRLKHVSLQLVGHHLKILVDLNCIELVGSQLKGNRTERIYRATKRQYFNVDEWQAIDPKGRQPVTAAILRLISEETGRSMAEGKFDERIDNHLSRSPLNLDEEGWSETVAILERALTEILAVNEKSAERAYVTGETLMTTRVVIMQYLLSATADEDLDESAIQ